MAAGARHGRWHHGVPAVLHHSDATVIPALCTVDVRWWWWWWCNDAFSVATSSQLKASGLATDAGYTDRCCASALRLRYRRLLRQRDSNIQLTRLQILLKLVIVIIGIMKFLIKRLTDRDQHKNNAIKGHYMCLYSLKPNSERPTRSELQLNSTQLNSTASWVELSRALWIGLNILTVISFSVTQLVFAISVMYHVVCVVGRISDQLPMTMRTV